MLIFYANSFTTVFRLQELGFCLSVVRFLRFNSKSLTQPLGSISIFSYQLEIKLRYIMNFPTIY